VKDPNTLQLLWFGLIAVLWTGYLVSEGFDFGVGLLLPFLGRTDTERRVMINTIGPVWDGNEVWLLTAGGAIFAAFPIWYATLFSAFYLPLLLVLVGLILRGVAFEYRGKIDSPAWRARWDAAIITGSLLPSLIWGVAFGNLIRGINATDLYATIAVTPDGTHLDPTNSHLLAHPTFSILLHALNPYALLTGIVVVVLFATHGAFWLTLKTTDTVHHRATNTTTPLALTLLITAGTWALWTQLAYGKTWTWIPTLIAAAAALTTLWAARNHHHTRGFLATTTITITAVTLVFADMYPNVITIHHNGQDVSALVNTTIATASSTNTTLTLMTWVAAIFLPIVLAYTTWTYWTFRHPITTTNIPTPTPTH
jgi:cytochrome d ubiquinol oxidase subunit II